MELQPTPKSTNLMACCGRCFQISSAIDSGGKSYKYSVQGRNLKNHPRVHIPILQILCSPSLYSVFRWWWLFPGPGEWRLFDGQCPGENQIGRHVDSDFHSRENERTWFWAADIPARNRFQLRTNLWPIP